jgi:hypothetical protein
MKIKTESKIIKHLYSAEEREALGGVLARVLGALRGIQSELDSIKASYKSKVAEAEAQIDRVSTNIINGFEMVQADCFVVYRPKDREKDYYTREGDAQDAGTARAQFAPVLTERMTQEDFQLALPEVEGTSNVKYNPEAE